MHIQHYNRSEGEIKELLVNIVEKINWEVVPNWLFTQWRTLGGKSNLISQWNYNLLIITV